MAWYHLKPKITKNLAELTKIYNEKYGHYDYSQDSRSLDRGFSNVLLSAVGNIDGLNIIVCGSNAGYEIEILSHFSPRAIFTAVDISTEALSILKKKFPYVAVVYEDMDKLSFRDKEFDLYVNCRAIHSTDVDMKKAINEAVRVTKGKIVLTVSNGYLIDGKIQNGMYDYDLKSIDRRKPFKIRQLLSKYLLERKYSLEYSESDAELFIIAKPDDSESV